MQRIDRAVFVSQNDLAADKRLIRADERHLAVLYALGLLNIAQRDKGHRYLTALRVHGGQPVEADRKVLQLCIPAAGEQIQLSDLP